MAPSRYAVRGLPRAAHLAAVVALVVGAAAGCSQPPPVEGSNVPAPSGSTSSVLPPTELDLHAEVVATGLEHPWDLGFLPDGTVLVTERPARLKLLSSTKPGARVTDVRADFDDVHAQGEGGLMGLLVHPDFATTRRFTTCQTHQERGTAVDVRLVTWTLSADNATATKDKDLLTGLPVAQSGRHSGCRMAIDATGALVVGTGDTASAKIPQDRTSLGGKVLRLDPDTGKPLPDNPFASSADPREKLVLSYGHRNIQGITLDRASGHLITAEHGPSFDDEVNAIVPGANYGWDPSKGGASTAYDESVPMTDLKRFPDARPALWTSGSTTQATCAIAVLDGPQWPGLDGALVVTALKGAKLIVLGRDAQGEVTSVAVPDATNGPFGRLRAARIGPDGALYVSTSNGEDDKVLRVTAR